MGATLAAAGVTAGSSVHVVLRNCPAFIAIWLACARSGAWLVPVDPTSTARDISRQLDRVRPAAGVCAASRADVYAAGVRESAAGAAGHDRADGDGRRRGTRRRNGRPLGMSGGAGGRTCDGGRRRQADRLAVMFTSGTTSEPKGVVAHAAQLRARRRHDVRHRRAPAGGRLAGHPAAVPRQRAVLLHRPGDRGRCQRRADLCVLRRFPVAAAGPRPVGHAREPEKSADPDDPGNRKADAPAAALQHVWFAQNLGAQHYDEFAELASCPDRGSCTA